MDIGKYIGLYLVKNGYCSLPGLGTLQLLKTPAKRTSGGEMSAPKTEIQFNNVGSIDDQFPHFIGLRENISSNNASNAISTFGKEVKETIQSNSPFVLDGIGRFVMKDGKIAFVPVSDFNLAEFDMTLPEVNDNPIDVDNTRVSNNNIGDKEMSFSNLGGTAIGERSINYSRLFIGLGTLALLATGIYFGWDYLSKNQEQAKKETMVATTDTVTNNTNVIADTANNLDSMASALAGQQATAAATPSVTAVDTATKPVTAATDSTKPQAFVGPAMKVVVRTYTTQVNADAYSKKLTSYGKTTMVNKLDSANYQVIVKLPSTDKPADQVINELRANYNPGEKFGKVTATK
jgi:hypothetical protein